MIVERLRRTRTMTFRALVADSPDTLTTVARFLALLELFREGAVAFDQVTPLGELSVRWTGSDEGEIEVGDEYDDQRRGERADDDRPDADSRTDATIEEKLAMTTRSTEDQTAERAPCEGAAERRRPHALRRLKPALEAVLMIADEPLDHLTPGAGGRRAARRRRARRWHELAAGVHRAGPWLRPAPGRGWLAVLLARGVRADRRAVRGRRPAGAADPGRARDAWPSSPTGSRSAGRGSPRSVASTSTA